MAVPPPAMVQASRSSNHAGDDTARTHDVHAQEDEVKHVAQQQLAALSQGSMKDVITSDAVRALSLVFRNVCQRECICAFGGVNVS